MNRTTKLAALALVAASLSLIGVTSVYANSGQYGSSGCPAHAQVIVPETLAWCPGDWKSIYPVLGQTCRYQRCAITQVSPPKSGPIDSAMIAQLESQHCVGGRIGVREETPNGTMLICGMMGLGSQGNSSSGGARWLRVKTSPLATPSPSATPLPTPAPTAVPPINTQQQGSVSGFITQNTTPSANAPHINGGSIGTAGSAAQCNTGCAGFTASGNGAARVNQNCGTNNNAALR